MPFFTPAEYRSCDCFQIHQLHYRNLGWESYFLFFSVSCLESDVISDWRTFDKLMSWDLILVIIIYVQIAGHSTKLATKLGWVLCSSFFSNILKYLITCVKLLHTFYITPLGSSFYLRERDKISKVRSVYC